jgi:peroxiredoxin Q/BCP
MGRELIAGAKAPAFALSRDGGGKVSLRDFKGGKLVLYFYPKADTPGCTKEAMEFSRLRADFAKAGTAILGVSADPVTAQDRFKSKHAHHRARIRRDKKMLTAYGAWGEKSMYGRKFMGVVRKTFLIDATADHPSGRKCAFPGTPRRCWKPPCVIPAIAGIIALPTDSGFLTISD